MRQQAATPQNDKTRNKNPNQDRECALRKNSKVLPLYSQGGMGYTNLVHSKKKKMEKHGSLNAFCFLYKHNRHIKMFQFSTHSICL